MKSLITLSIFLICISTSKADYKRLLIHETINVSQLIIQGKIIKVDSTYFTFEIKKCIKGEHFNKTIEVKRFKNWSCASRWGNYQINQEALLCLIKRNNNWEVTGFGNEGEMPIENDNLYIITPYGLKGKSTYKKHAAIKLSLKEALDGITYYISSKDILEKAIDDRSILNLFPLSELLRKIQIELIAKNAKKLELSYQERQLWLEKFNIALNFSGIWILHQKKNKDKLITGDSLLGQSSLKTEIRILPSKDRNHFLKDSSKIEGIVIAETDYKGCVINPETFEFEEATNACKTVLCTHKSNPFIWFKIGEGLFKRYEVYLNNDLLIFKETFNKKVTHQTLIFKKKN